VGNEDAEARREARKEAKNNSVERDDALERVLLRKPVKAERDDPESKYF
jgi:hypothetical protein